MDEKMEKAMESGRSAAREIVTFRNAELEKRKQALRKKTAGESPARAESVDVGHISDLLGPQSGEVLIAEGDSWFDYPFHDILRILEDHYGYDIESVAHKGDRMEEMAYGAGQFEALVRRIEKVLRRGIVPRAVLLSGGGNDLAGVEFGMILNHASSAVPGLNGLIVEGLINERLKTAYISILSGITEVCRLRIGNPVPIVIHGYDYPVPDGRGFLGGGGILPGPWLEPGFRSKGFSNMDMRIDMVKNLIDRFNEMLLEVSSLPAFPHVTYIDVRGTLDLSGNYKEDWANEMHPSAAGFRKITSVFAETLSALKKF
jgi:hypothetical protein